MNRREMLVSLGLSSLIAPALVRAAAASGDGGEKVEYLFVQSAAGAILADGKLTLSGVQPSTLYFSDRPERIVGHTPTKTFVGKWGEGEDSFSQDPPNAALSILDGEEPEVIVVVLRKPHLEGDSLVYEVDVLDGSVSATGGSSSLFIDVVGRPLTPISVSGARRRTRRRVVREVR